MSDGVTGFRGSLSPMKQMAIHRLTGQIPDQSALYGHLRKVRDLAMPLLSVNRLELGQTDVAGLNQRINGE